jgi:hypothetical protein
VLALLAILISPLLFCCSAIYIASGVASSIFCAVHHN